MKARIPVKAVVLAIVIGSMTAGLLFAQGRVFSGPAKPYDPKTPPVLTLPRAFALAVAHIGSATNRFYCLSAICLERTLPGYPGWVLWFSNTNGERARVEVYFGDKDAYIPDAKSAALLR